MPPFVRVLLWTVAAPLVLGTVAFVLPRGRAAAVPLALGAAVATAHAALLGMPRFPAGDAVAWLFWVALGASCVGLLELAWRAPTWARLALRLALAGLLLLVLLWQPYLAQTWSGGEGVAYLAGLGMVTVASWTALGCCGEQLSGRRHALLLTALAAGAAVVLGVTGTASLALLAVALAATCAPAIVLGRQAPASLASGSTIFALVLAALLVEGHFYSDAPAPSVLLLAAAPLAALAGARVARGLNGWPGILAIAPALLAIAAAVGIALARSVVV